jgi:parvulin-like peptidyl-prolyl isomerase
MTTIFVLALILGVADADAAAALARINGEPIYAAEAETEFRRAYGDRKFSEDERKQLLRAALDQVIDRRLVLAYLTNAGQAASAQDIDLALAQFEKDLQSQNLTLEKHLKQVGLTAEDIRRALAWKLSWQRYLERQLTEQNLEKYFQRYRREFDGTQLRVSQILLKLPDADEIATKNAKTRASQLKQEIVAGKLAFAEAAKQHSQAPSSKDGGDIGWIERKKPMPEDFSRAAYSLKPGEISEPFVSPFGVHLITVLEDKPGMKTWRDVEAELRPAVTLYLFRWIADKERTSANIEYTP